MELSTVLWITRAVRRRWWLALLVAVAVLLADSVVTWQSPRTYQARASILIGPSTTVDPGQLVYSVDALGRSMIVGTYANVLDTDLVRREAIEQAGAGGWIDPAIQIKTAALADSAVVQVTAVAPNPQLAADVANSVAHVGELHMSQLYPMYELTLLTEAIPPTTVFEPNVKRNASIGVLLAALAGVCLASAIELWTQAPSISPRD
jgi:succinoglycan biosynthesis transport protein ExoP